MRWFKSSVTSCGTDSNPADWSGSGGGTLWWAAVTVAGVHRPTTVRAAADHRQHTTTGHGVPAAAGYQDEAGDGDRRIQKAARGRRVRMKLWVWFLRIYTWTDNLLKVIRFQLQILSREDQGLACIYLYFDTCKEKQTSHFYVLFTDIVSRNMSKLWKKFKRRKKVN